jgi:hypothetical protein
MPSLRTSFKEGLEDGLGDGLKPRYYYDPNLPKQPKPVVRLPMKNPPPRKVS